MTDSLLVRWCTGRIVEVETNGVATAAQNAGIGDQLNAPSTLSAGLVDLQVNGVAGVDFASSDAAGWLTATKALASHGVTAFCPTFVSAPVETLVQFARRCATFDATHIEQPLARSLGAHLEGPYLSPEYAGAHLQETLRTPDPSDEPWLLDAAADIAIMTIAPELDGAAELIAKLVDSDVRVSLGHTAATAVESRHAVERGATMATHLYNAMRPLHHRAPGLIGVALTDDRVTSGLIVDGVHLADDTVRLAFAAAPGRIALVSDGTSATGMPAGTYQVGTIDPNVDANGVARNKAGRLAGSTIWLDHAVRQCLELGIEPALVLAAATEIPAKQLGRTDVGHITVGATADLIRWDSSWDQVDMVAAGRWVHGRAFNKARASRNS